GPARYFHECRTEAELRQALTAARERRLRVQIIGGGSNLVVADAGFPGLVLKVAIGGVTFRDAPDGVELVAGAGVEWGGLGRQPLQGARPRPLRRPRRFLATAARHAPAGPVRGARTGGQPARRPGAAGARRRRARRAAHGSRAAASQVDGARPRRPERAVGRL